MTTVQIERVNNSWSELCHSVNRILQAGNGDPHRIQLQMTDLALWEQYWTEVHLYVNRVEQLSHSHLTEPGVFL